MIRNIILVIIFFFTYFFINLNVNSQEKISADLSEYLITLNNFKCRFVQANPYGDVSEGVMIYSDSRFRINYTTPSKITFIARGNKAMYFNEDLMEVEYFNPNKTALKTFESLFNLNNLPSDAYEIILIKNIIQLKLIDTKIDEIESFNIFFQTNPIELKKIEWLEENGKSTFSIFNIKKNIHIDKKTFNMANPILN